MLTLFMKIYGLLVLAKCVYKIAEYRDEEDDYLITHPEAYKLWKELRDMRDDIYL